MQRFVREAAAARDIRHPGIAAVYDVSESDGQAYFTTEVVGGVSLRDWNRRRLTSGSELGMSSISALIFTILDAITTIHIRKLVADVSAAKIMLLSDPAQPGIRIKLVDVGIPLLTAASETGATGFGANPYRAPEALTISGEALQPSADIYSVSMIFYELLTGVALAGHWQAPSADRKDVPPAVDALIQVGLSNAPRRRPQSAEEFCKQLEAALGEGVDPKPGPKPKPDRKPDPKPDPGPKVVVNTWKIPDFLAPILKTLNMPFAGIMLMIQSMVSWLEVLTFSGRPLQLATRKAVRGGLAVVVTLGLLALATVAVWGTLKLVHAGNAVPDDELDGGPTPRDRDVDPTPLPPPPPRPPPPPPTRSPYAAFQGYWTDDFGDNWTVGIDRAGRVKAKATGGNFAGTQMIGTFNGSRFDFAFGNAYGTGQAVGAFDGGCHIQYQTLDPYGSGRMVNAQFHINHQPGAPCP